MFRKVSELLESGDISQEAANAIDAEVSIALKGLKDDRESLQTKNKELTSAYNEVMQSKSDLDVQLADIDEKIKQAKKDGQVEIAKKLENEKAAQEVLQKSLETLQTANTALKLDSAVSQELNKFDIRKEDRDLVEFRLRANVKLNDEGSVTYTSGGSTVSITDGFGDYFKNNQSRLNPKGDNSGSGTTGGGSGGTVDTSKMSPSQMMAEGRK